MAQQPWHHTLFFPFSEFVDLLAVRPNLILNGNLVSRRRAHRHDAPPERRPPQRPPPLCHPSLASRRVRRAPQAELEETVGTEVVP